MTLSYQDGSRSELSVPVSDARAELELPLTGRLRTVQFNEAGTIPVQIDD